MIIWHPMPGGGIGTSVADGLINVDLTYNLGTRGYVMRANERQVGEQIFASFNLARRCAEVRIRRILREALADLGPDRGWDRRNAISLEY